MPLQLLPFRSLSGVMPEHALPVGTACTQPAVKEAETRRKVAPAGRFGRLRPFSWLSHEAGAPWDRNPGVPAIPHVRTEEPRPMNTPLRRASVFCLALILALMGWATWIQGAKASDYMGDPHN